MFNDDPRRTLVRMIYQNILGREPDAAGLKLYADSNAPLEMVYMRIFSSAEAEEKRKHDRQREAELLAKGSYPLTLAMFVKDVEESVEMAIRSVLPIVREVVILDTGSTDNTVSICKELGARVYQINTQRHTFHFGEIRTLTAHLAREKWVLGLDADETILEEDYDKVGECIRDESVDIWGLPRNRWADLEMTQQLERDVYPDWQYRLFQNKTEIRYKRRIHEIIDGSSKRKESPGGPHIQHFQDSFKSGDRLMIRNEQYKALYQKDLDEGVEHKERAVEELDER